MTATSGSVFTAAQFNTNVRDNLLETGPALVPATGYILVSDGTNSLQSRGIAQGAVDASEYHGYTYFTDLTTVGPAVTVTTGVRAIVAIHSHFCNNSSTGGDAMGYEVSGASSIAASDAYSIGSIAVGTNSNIFGSGVFLQSGLTAGSNVFTAKYKAAIAGNGVWSMRKILVIGL